MISLDLVFGLFLILGGYMVLWFSVIHASRTIETINSSERNSAPEILDLFVKWDEDD